MLSWDKHCRCSRQWIELTILPSHQMASTLLEQAQIQPSASGRLPQAKLYMFLRVMDLDSPVLHTLLMVNMCLQVNKMEKGLFCGMPLLALRYRSSLIHHPVALQWH